MDSSGPTSALRQTDSNVVALDTTRGSAVAADAASVDDGALMLRYRNGDARAFELLYIRHKGSLYRYLQRMCRNREAVNDLFQEVWSKVIVSRERYEVRAQFSTFLFRIAHNCAVDYFRRAERQHIGRTADVTEMQELLPGADTDRPDTQASEAQLQAAFKQSLQALPEEQRNVFVLFEETGLTLAEIAQVTGVGMETAKSRLRYALSKLRSALRHYDPRDLQSSKQP
ncbi:MAG: RNA polymerase sigma factor [Candidatus Obscuribacterales bacterium]|nr:RNA polymerase sigma factor [Steroidobacteraceae bacterium]